MRGAGGAAVAQAQLHDGLPLLSLPTRGAEGVLRPTRTEQGPMGDGPWQPQRVPPGL